MKCLGILSTILLACLLAPTFAAAQDSWEHAIKEAADATWQPPQILNEAETLAVSTSDIAPDWNRAYWPATTSLMAKPLAVRRYTEITGVNPLTLKSFTYVLLYQRRAGNGLFDALILKLDANNNPVTSFGPNGFKRLDVGFDTLEAATFGTESFGPPRAFFAGSKWVSGLFNFDMAVACLDASSADGKCSGWSPTSTSLAPFNYAGTGADLASVIQYDPDGYIFIAGKVARTEGFVIGAAKIKASDGLFDTSFAASGKTWYSLNGLGAYDPQITASAFAASGTPGGKRLYIAGSFQPGSDPNDRDGFILSASTVNSSFSRKWVYNEIDNAGNKKDEVTAVSVLKNGKVAYAGWSETDDANYQTILLGRLKAVDVTADASFCGSGMCSHVVGGPLYLGGGIRSVRPRAIAERKMNGDLVVAVSGTIRDPSPINPVSIPRQILQLWNSRGSQQYASAGNEYTFSTSSTAGAWSGPIEVADSDVILTGERRWTDTNFDVTVARHLRLDSIFASSFGGATSD